ncbi:hypothetical protein M011DRAFT_396454 [Sporormia fimetaria CBS 119925]|uniref:Rhodopsin domain-containing protein n=1 Tax=Sporormia fimetaria CBS 119925 TaxID=1340428 RepID=A0A6A6VMA4_9PLEO|nr:hypothetical protein M011DRAFT_396454 [Sporormia fimetaria CBS 119925]
MVSHSASIEISLWVVTFIPLAFLLLRLYCKKRFERKYGADDVLLVISWILCVGYTALGHVAIESGVGQHMSEVSKDRVRYVKALRYFYLTATTNLFAMPLSKTSFCVTLLKVTETTWHRRAIWFVIITLNATCAVTVGVSYGQCTPVSKVWNSEVPGRCWSPRVLVYSYVFQGAYSVLLDVGLGTLPYLLIRNLQINKREKVGLIFAMSMGVFAGVAGAVKTAYLATESNWQDPTWYIAKVLVWSLAETAISIIAASVPFLRMLVRQASSTKGTTARSRENGTKLSNVLSSRLSRNVPAGNSSMRVYDDYNSEDIILWETGKPPGIMQTSEVKVEYAEGGRSKAGNFADCT